MFSTFRYAALICTGLTLFASATPVTLPLTTVAAQALTPPVDRRSVAEQLVEAAQGLVTEGNVSQAIANYQQASAIYEELGDRIAAARILQEMGQLYRQKNQLEHAITAFQAGITFVARPASRAMEPISSDSPDVNLEASLQSQLGETYRVLQQYPAAIAAYSRSVELHRQTSNLLGQRYTLRELGYTFAAAGQQTKALEQYQAALSLARRLGIPLEIGKGLMDIASVYQQQNQFSQAIAMYQEAIAIVETLDEQAAWQAELHKNLGQLYVNNNQPTEALAAYRRSLEYFEQVGDRSNLQQVTEQIEQIQQVQQVQRTKDRGSNKI
jgi:tetratricopeptide (TPR) repeat protein